MIDQRSINPFLGRLGGAGSPTYSDFSQASAEEYFDFRNGIGKKRGLSSEARLEWSEGIDFTSEGQAVLGGLVTTAGSFGAAPVKIIDFQSGTYAVGNAQISKWNTSGSSWTLKASSLATPLDAIVITDDTDEYLVVTSAASNVLYTTDGDTWSRLKAMGDALDFTTYTEVDTSGRLTVTSTKATAVNAGAGDIVYIYLDKNTATLNALDVDFEIYINSDSTTDGRGGMAISNTVGVVDGFASTDISVMGMIAGGPNYNIMLVRGDSVSEKNYACSANTIYYCTLTRVAASDTVTLKVYSDSTRETLLDTLTETGFGTTTRYRYVYGFVNQQVGTGDFDGYVQNLTLNRPAGYVADYANRLYAVSTDGKTVHYSASKDIDTFGGVFTLTGNFGTIYDLFEGKLLADGTPVLYMAGTEGLFTIDVTNEIAYKQEVAYPNLTYAGHKGLYWNANVWVATGYGILKVAPSVATYIGPDLDDGLPTGYMGYVYDMVTVNNWLVYCVNGGSSDKSSIIKRNSSYGGNLQVYTTSAVDKAIACLHHSPSSLYTNGRLWFGEGTDVKYMMFPDTTSNVKQIATYTYVNDSGYGTFPIFRKMAGIPKTALRVAAITKSCSATDYIQVFYGLNGAAATTSLGTFISSPKPTTLTFNSGLGTTFYTIQFAIKLFQGATATNSPELESLIFYYFPTPTRINSWTMNILATGDEGDRIFSEFETILDTNTLVAFYPSGDSGKTAYYVKLTQMPSRSWWEEMGGRAGYFTVVLAEISKD